MTYQSLGSVKANCFFTISSAWSFLIKRGEFVNCPFAKRLAMPSWHALAASLDSELGTRQKPSQTLYRAVDEKEAQISKSYHR
jgi:hypothetical protein